MIRNRPYRAPVRFLRYLPDGRLLSVGGGAKSIWIWEPGNKQPSRKLLAGSSILAIATSTDGKLIAARTASSRIVVWDEATGRQLSSMIWHAPPASELEFVPNTKRLCAASWNGIGEYEDPTVTSVDFRRSDLIWDVRSAHYLSISISHDSRWMISTLSQTSGLALSELAIFDRLNNRRSTANTGDVLCQRVRFLPDSTLFLACERKPVACSLWSFNPLDQIMTFGLSTEGIQDFAITPDGQRFLTVDLEGRVIIWNLKAGKPESEYDWRLDSLASVAVAPDGLTYAIGSDRGDVQICDLE